MRISTLQIFNIANVSIAQANQAMIHTQEQMATGQRVLTPADDPVAATKILQLDTELSRIDQYGKNINIAENTMVLEETTLDSVLTLIQRIQEIAVQAGNTAVLTESEYAALASETEARLDELFNLVNTRNANGDYIFSGFKGSTPAFSGDKDKGYTYEGDQGQLFIKVSNNTRLAISDSGKFIFDDVPSVQPTINTSANPNNRSLPPISISLGEVIDQDEYNDFYPEDIVITFNPDSSISPPGKNFTVTERSTGNVIEANRPYVAGEDIEYHGLSFRVTGNPWSGVPATPASRLYAVDGAVTFPVDFTPPANSSIDVSVGGITETLVLDANITSAADLTAVFNSAVNGNAAKLANLGLVVDDTGFYQLQGLNFSISGGDANTDQVMGIATQTGSTSVDGVRAVKGDQLFVDSSDSQSLLNTIARFSAAMSNYDGTDEARDYLEEVVATTLGNLGHAQTAVLSVTTTLGARFNALDSTRNLHLDTELVSREILSDLRDLDYAEAATRLSAQTLILDAAQSSFIRVSQLSLFNRL